MRLWPWRRRAEPEHEEPAAAEPPAAPPPEEPPPAPLPEEPRGEPVAPGRRLTQPASAFERPYAPQAEAPAAPVPPAEPPEAVSLTLEEAKVAIRAAGGDVIQIGFLARAYRRHQDEEPGGREAAVARKRLCDLVAKRLEDRKLLAPEGRFELLEEPPGPA
jgi:hypothetical protein